MELIRVLSYPKFQLTVGEQEDLIAEYLPWCEKIMVTHPPTVPSCRDPSDRPFLELALQSRADALVTGDGDLLALAPVFAIPILTPHATRSRWGQGSTDRNA
jgi:putative PIN family toxin of toxin-antitoxin system